MERVPAARAIAAALLSAGMLSACSTGGEQIAREGRPAAPVSSAPASPASPSAPPSLTEAQARAALITEKDLGEPWAPTEGAATWRDGFLKAGVPANLPDCRRLLDVLYAEELLGAPARAVVGLDDGWDEAQLRYQVTSRPPRDVDDTLAWLRTLPRTCAKFTATTAGGARRGVEVEEADLPEVGDARQGLRVTVRAQDQRGYDGEPVTLTLDVVAVRVGEDAFALTNGGLGEVYAEVTRAAAELGAERLAQVRRQGRVQV
jgi:hypothetical protein